MKTSFEVASTIVSGVTSLNVPYTEPVEYVEQPSIGIYQQADTHRSIPYSDSGDRTGFMIETYAQYEANEKKEKCGAQKPLVGNGISGNSPNLDETHIAIRIKDNRAEVIISNDRAVLEHEIAKIEQQEMTVLDSQPNTCNHLNVIGDVHQGTSLKGVDVNTDHMLPSSAKGKWTGEPGNSYFIPNDPMIMQRCIEKGSIVRGSNGEVMPAIQFENGKVQFDSFAESLNGHHLIGDIPNITTHRDVSPRGKDFDAVEVKNMDNGSMNTEYQKSMERMPKMYVSGDPVENTQALMKETKAMGDRPFSVRGMNDASNYDQAIASIAKDMNMAQSDMRYLIDVSGKEMTSEDTAKLHDISERSGIGYEQLVDLTSEKLTIHEQVYTDAYGNMRSEGIVMRSDIHQAIHHEGAVKEVKGKSIGDSFNKDSQEEQHDDTNNSGVNDQLTSNTENNDMVDDNDESQADDVDLSSEEGESPEDSNEQSDDQVENDGLTDDEGESQADDVDLVDDNDESQADDVDLSSEEGESPEDSNEQSDDQVENDGLTDDEGESQADDVDLSSEEGESPEDSNEQSDDQVENDGLTEDNNNSSENVDNMASDNHEGIDSSDQQGECQNNDVDLSLSNDEGQNNDVDLSSSNDEGQNNDVDLSSSNDEGQDNDANLSSDNDQSQSSSDSQGQDSSEDTPSESESYSQSE